MGAGFANPVEELHRLMTNDPCAGVDKLIAIDLDGTLVAPDNSISPENIAAMRRAADQGAAVIIVTGRPYVSADTVAERLGLPAVPLVSFNGALIRWTGRGETLFSDGLAADAASEIVEQCLCADLHLHYYLDEILYVSQYNEHARRYCERAQMSCVEEPDMRRFAGQQPLKLLVVDEPVRINQLLVDCRERWGNRVYVTRSMAEYLEFLSPQVSKGHALDWLLEFYGLRRERALAIGDSMNDLPLLKHAGSAVAMPDADEDLKELADYVPSQATSGVAEAIDWFLGKL
jgi:Cof subfamily protein (haloacid dehalogenase superfamily)